METTVTRSRALAGIDVHKKMPAVVVRRDENGVTGYQQRSVGATRNEIEHLAASQIAWAAVHIKGTFFAQLFTRLKPGIEAKGAVSAPQQVTGI